MNRKATFRRKTTSIVLTLAAGFCLVSSTGCQVSLNGQTLPSPYYLQDDVQYFPAGPEFKLTKQVEATRKYQLEQEQLRGGANL